MMLSLRKCPVIDQTWGCKDDNPYWAGHQFSFYNGLFSDTCCHPRSPSHAFIAAMVGFMIDSEIYVASSVDAPAHTVLDFEHDRSIDGDGSPDATWLPAVLKLTPDEDRYWVSIKASMSMSFNDGNNLPTAEAFGEWDPLDWAMTADSKGKFGLISTTPYTHVSIKVTLGAQTQAARLTLGYMRSYKNVSAAAFWINDQPGLADNEADIGSAPGRCNPTFAQAQDWIESYSTIRESVYEAHQIPIDMVTSSTMYLHLCCELKMFPHTVPHTECTPTAFELLAFMLRQIYLMDILCFEAALLLPN